MHLERQQQSAITLALLVVFTIWQINGVYLAALARISVTLFWLADFIQWIVLPALLLLFLARWRAIFPRHYGFATSTLRGWQSIPATLAILVTTGLAYYVTQKIMWRLLNQPSGFFTFPGVFPDGALGVAVSLYAALTAGFIESIFFIGLPWLLYQNNRSAPSRSVFTLVTSVIFAAAHWEQGPHIVLAAFSFELVACAWFFRLKSLWPVAAGHALLDLIEFS